MASDARPSFRGRTLHPAGHDAETVDDGLLVFKPQPFQLHLLQRAHQLLDSFAVSLLRRFGDLTLEFDLLPAQGLRALMQGKGLEITVTRILDRGFLSGSPES